MKKNILAVNIILDIIADFTDRRGLQQEWEQIDKDIQDEIKQEWIKIIEHHLGEDR